MYLEVFSFKLCAAWTDHLENYISGAQKHNKHNLHVHILYINVIISYSFRVCSQHGAWMNAAMFIHHCERFEHSRCDWLNHTTWSHGNCRTHNTETLELIKKKTLSRIFEFDTILSFVHNTDVNMLYRLFSDRKYMNIYLPIHQEYGYLCKQTNSLYFPTLTCEHLWPSPCIIHGHTTWFSARDFPVEDLASTTTTSKHQRFTLNMHNFKLQKRS